MALPPSAPLPLDPDSTRNFVIERYTRAIEYYWNSSKRNKNAFKWTRLATIVLGSVVTLLASLTSTDLLVEDSPWRAMFTVGTPVLAALLTVIGAVSQTFQWEAAWRESVMTATRLQKECDRVLVTPPAEVKADSELERLNDFILHESESFFDRVLGRSKPPVDSDG